MPSLSISRRVFLSTLALLPFSKYVWAARVSQKTIDKKTASEVGEYGIGFASKASDGGFDHAFLVWYYSDPNGSQTVRRGAGFYPVANDNTKSYDMILGVTGKVIDDSKTKISQELTILVNKDIFDAAIAVEDKYKNDKTYRLGFDDCTTFVSEVASQIPNLSLPNRALNIYPSSYIQALFNKN
jgi:hypothetical protein